MIVERNSVNDSKFYCCYCCIQGRANGCVCPSYSQMVVSRAICVAACKGLCDDASFWTRSRARSCFVLNCVLNDHGCCAWICLLVSSVCLLCKSASPRYQQISASSHLSASLYLSCLLRATILDLGEDARSYLGLPSSAAFLPTVLKTLDDRLLSTKRFYSFTSCFW